MAGRSDPNFDGSPRLAAEESELGWDGGLTNASCLASSKPGFLAREKVPRP